MNVFGVLGLAFFTLALLACTDAPQPVRCDWQHEETRDMCEYVGVCRSRFEGAYASPVAAVNTEERVGPFYHCVVQTFRGHVLVARHGFGTVSRMVWLP